MGQYIYIYIYMCVCVCIYIYIYIERERERDPLLGGWINSREAEVGFQCQYGGKEILREKVGF